MEKERNHKSFLIYYQQIILLTNIVAIVKYVKKS